jgi:ferredoxin
MIIFYFSGTVNSKYIAELFAQNMNCACHSIEEDTDFEALINSAQTIAFCYPIYASRVPKIMRGFVKRQAELLKGKKLIIFCTQMLFSGDGARALTALLPGSRAQVIYAEHFFMPSNIFPVTTDEKKIKNYVSKAERKMQKVCDEIKSGKVRRRGFNPLSRVLGLIQAPFLPLLEKKADSRIETTQACTNCGVCVSLCPMKNLRLEDNKITHSHNCTVCYRCVNKCPKKALIVGAYRRVAKQYKGL